MIDYGLGVELGPLDSENIDLYREWRNSLSIRRWCRQKSLLNEVGHENWFESQAVDPRIEMFEVRTVCEAVGVCGLTDIDHHNQRAEFSLYIGPEHHGQGLGEKALRTLVRFGFEELNLNMIYGETVGDNPAQTMFGRVGFIRTGHRPQMYYKEGAWQDSHLYCLLRSQFLA